MGRPPSNGGPSFRFNQIEIAEMEAILQAHKTAMPDRQVLVNLAEKFSKSEERLGKIEVQMKQVWNWFQNRRYAIRAKAAKAPGKLNVTQMPRDDSSMVKGVPQVTQPHAASLVNIRSLPQVPQHPTVPSASIRTFPQAPQQPPAFSVHNVGRVTDNSQMEYEAKSARDGAWYDVSTFLSHRSLETGDPEVFVRFAGFGAEEDEWVDVRKNVRQRSLPCEASECVAVLPADLILCFQEGKEQALYFDAHVLDAQRRRHDVRGCRCRFLVRYDHDQSEEIVALRKICRRPETDYRLQQLHAVNEAIAASQNKNGANNNNNNNHIVSTLRVYPPAEVQPKQQKAEAVVPPEAPQKRQRLEETAPEGSQMQFKADHVMANVPQNQQTVQPAVPDQASIEPEKVQPVVHVPSAHSDEVPVELQKVQPLMLDKAEPVPTGEVHEAMGPAVPPSTEAPHEGEPELVEPQKEPEPVVSGSSVVVPAKLRDVQPHTSELETKSEEPMLAVSVIEPNVVQETKIEDPVVTAFGSEANVVQEAKTEEHVVPVEPNVVQEATTEEPVVSIDPNVAQEAKIEEPVMPVDSNVAQGATAEEPVVSVDPNVAQEAKTEEPVDPNVAQEATTEELMVHVDSNVIQEATAEELMVPVDSNRTQEAKTESVDPNVVQWATTEELMVHFDSNVTQEATTEELMVPVDSNRTQEATTEYYDPNVAQWATTEELMMLVDSNEVHEAKIEEPVVPVEFNVTQEAITESVDPNVAQGATAEELMMPVDSNVVQESKIEELVGPVDSNVVLEAKTEEPVNDPIVIETETEIMEINEEDVAENVSDDKDAVAMEEEG